MAHGELGPIEEYANIQVTATMSGHTYTVLAAVLLGWAEEHKDDPEAKDFIKELDEIKWVRSR